MSSDATEVREAAPRYVAQAGAQDVPPGYKRTEVGLLPKDWSAKQLGEFGTLRSGSGFPLRYQGRQEGDYPFFKVSDMNNPGNELFMESSNHWIDEAVRRELSAEAFPPGSIVFAKIGAAIFLERKKLLVRDSCLDNNMMAYVLTDRSASSRFFHYVLLRVELGKLVSTTALPSLSGRQIASVRIPIPPPLEQRAIAEALSDVDGLLGALEALIAKKRAIKQAAMQQLLTGKTRLPGFSGEWETKKIRDVAMPSGDRNSTSDDLPVLTCSKHLGFVDSLGYFKNQVFSKDLSNYKVVRRGEIGYPANHVEEGSIGLQDLYDVALVSPIYVVFATLESINSYFLHRLLKLDSYRQLFATATNASVDRRGSLRWPAFSEISIRFPSKAEQDAIATVLSDMDAEIAALEARRDKTRAIKQGMMQQLLTGRVRLVTPEAAA